MHIRDVFSQRHACSSVNDLNPDRCFALCFEDIIDQVLGCKIDIAPSVRVVLTEHALRVQTTQRPVTTSARVRLYHWSQGYRACQTRLFEGGSEQVVKCIYGA